MLLREDTNNLSRVFFQGSSKEKAFFHHIICFFETFIGVKSEKNSMSMEFLVPRQWLAVASQLVQVLRLSTGKIKIKKREKQKARMNQSIKNSQKKNKKTTVRQRQYELY